MFEDIHLDAPNLKEDNVTLLKAESYQSVPVYRGESCMKQALDKLLSLNGYVLTYRSKGCIHSKLCCVSQKIKTLLCLITWSLFVLRNAFGTREKSWPLVRHLLSSFWKHRCPAHKSILTPEAYANESEACSNQPETTVRQVFFYHWRLCCFVVSKAPGNKQQHALSKFWSVLTQSFAPQIQRLSQLVQISPLDQIFPKPSLIALSV